MKNYIISILATTLLSTSSYATSIKNVVEQTIDANPDILSEKFNKEAFKKYVDQEEGDYYPTIDFSGYVEDSTTDYDRDDQPNDPSSADKDGWNASITVDQIIYDGGLTPSEVEEYKHLYNSNKYRSNQRVEEIVKEAVSSYIDLVRYQELLNLSLNNLKMHEEYLIIAREKEEISGEILESYQVNSKKHYITDRLLEQKQLQNEARDKYLSYTQKAIDGNICRPIINESIIPDKLEKILEIAINKNYSVLEQVEKIKEQRENLVQEKAGYLPTLRFQWQSSWDNDLSEAENGREDIHRARIILDWNIFNGGKTFHATKREKLFLQEQQKILDNVISKVKQEVTTAYKLYFSSKQRVENLKKYVVDNMNIRDVYLEQLKDGTRTFIDILNAESELYRSEIDALEEEIDIYPKYYDILEKMGLLSETILRSDTQVCSTYVPTKYVNPMKKNEVIDNSEVEDKELLNELGVNSNLDNEINQLINTNTNTSVEKTSKEKALTKKLPKGRYTINVATLENKDGSLEVFKQKYNLQNDRSLHTYNMSLGTKVLYGSFDSFNEANNAIVKLNKVKGLEVYIDYLDKHRKLLEKYKSIN